MAGKSHFIADALSRFPVFQPQEEELTIDCAVNCLRTTDSRALQAISELKGEEYATLIREIEAGRKLSRLPTNKPARISIHEENGDKLAMLDGTRIIIPDSAVKDILNELHRAHSGTEKMYKTASQLYRCLLYTSPSPRDKRQSRMPSSA